MLVTGASSGIGAALARAATAERFRVVAVARGAEQLTKTAAATGALPVPADVAVPGDMDRAVSAALDAHGRLDVVVANAGIGAPRGFTASTPERWREMVLTNVLGTALTIRAAVPALRAHTGHLVLVSSIAGRQALSGSLYSATKHAVTAMGESVRAELSGSGVRVTLVEPGTVNTPYFATPPPGALEPEDIARAILYAVSQPPHVDVGELFVRPTAQAN
ncbi:MAG: SDR family oxidoreductase [Solirubrobacteraceae bacterium]|nr:SDR family oxidoreductase [Solirubrobacteraceae bacterium]